MPYLHEIAIDQRRALRGPEAGMAGKGAALRVGTEVALSGKTRLSLPRVAGCLVLALGAQLLAGGERAPAQVWPIRIDPSSETAAVEPGDVQILDAHIQSLSAPFAATTRALLSQSDVLPYCGDGDGCHLTLLMFRASSELPLLRGERDLFITSAGSTWQVYKGSVLENTGNLTDGTLEEAYFLGGLDRCAVAEELTSIGNIERFFLVAVSDPASMPPLPTECRLRIED